MELKNYRLFVQLLESVMLEDSTAIAMLGSRRGGNEVAKYLHASKQLAHNQQFKQVEKILWNDLKDMYQGGWVLIKGSKSSGAIRASSNGYESVAYSPESRQIETFKNDRGGNILDFLKARIGRLEFFYVGADTGEVPKKKDIRQTQKAGMAGASASIDTIVTKFKPVWLKSIDAAEADIKGMITTMIKNNAYDKAEKKLNRLKTLRRISDELQAGELPASSNDMTMIQNNVRSALYMAAAHHYPDLTGEITRSRYSGLLDVQNSAGPDQILKDISSGNTKTLGTVLGFFKRNLITG
jgi:hypothetical protein